MVYSRKDKKASVKILGTKGNKKGIDLQKRVEARAPGALENFEFYVSETELMGEILS